MFGCKFLHASKFSLLPISSPLFLNTETGFSWKLIKAVTVPVSFRESKILGKPWKWQWDWGLWARQRGVWTLSSSEVWGEKEVQLVNTGRFCDIKFVHTEELRGTKKAEKLQCSSQRHKSLPCPFQCCPMGQEWHPQPWVHCPESQDTLWDTEEELPRTVYDFLDGFYRNKEVAKWKGLHDPRSMVKSKTEGQEDKHFNQFLVSEFDRVWKFHCLINFF